MIMKQNSLAEYISKYFSSYLLDERGVTRSTIIIKTNLFMTKNIMTFIRKSIGGDINLS